MKKRLLRLTVLLLLISLVSYAQDKTISGTVKAKDGSAMPGVSILLKGTAIGTTSDADGGFKISVPSDESVLVFSFIGHSSQEITVGNRTSLDVTMEEDATQLGEVVVTALGLERDTKSLTYAVQQIGGDKMTESRDVNFVNALSGRVAGITLNRSASGIGGSTRIVIRGNKSTTNNQALYVIDGVPMQSPSIGQPTDVWGQSSGSGSSGRDGGDAISNINPDDIESISVLKGASAAALYGSQAANGVILITTKKGKAGQSKIDYSSNYTMENVLLQPQLQYKYGQTATGTKDSWGSVVNAPNHVKDFWKTGHTWINSISLSSGTEKAQTYISYSNTTNNGIMPTSTFNRHTLNFRETAKFLNDKLSVDASVNLTTQKTHNRPGSGLYGNPLTGLYAFPRGLNFNQYKNNYEYFSPSRNMYSQDWWNINYDQQKTGEDDQQNPYWQLYRNTRDDSRNRVFGSLVLKYNLTSWLSVQARGRFDKSYDKYEFKAYAGTQGVIAAPNGRYTLDDQFNTQLYGDIILTGNKNLSDDLALTFTAGSSIQDFKSNYGSLIDTSPNDPNGLNIPNIFSVQNISPSAERVTNTLNKKQLQGVFASTTLGFKDKIFLDLTARNDWSSAFAYTSVMKKGYFYYSAGINAVLSEMITLPEFVSFAKLRTSYAKVGNDVPAYMTHPRDYSDNATRNSVDQNVIGPNPYKQLRPEDNRSFEVGTELKFINNRVGLDVTYYNNNNYKQFVTSAAGKGASVNYSTWYWNLGNIRNTGIEASLFVVPLKTGALTWTSTLNFAANKNKVVKMSDASSGISSDNWQVLSDFGVNMYSSFIHEGGRWGDLYANKTVKRSNGAIVVDATGNPITENKLSTKPGTDQYQYIGNPLPKFTLGWNNSFDIKNFTVNFLVDGRFGGQVVSVTQSYLDYYGYSKVTADARDNGGVNVKAVYEDGTAFEGKLDAKKYYQAIGNRSGVAGEYVYSATNVRLREFSVGYKLPFTIRGVKNINLSLVGRNLFFFQRNAPFDPDLVMSTGNSLQGVDVFSMPSTRSIGFNLKVGL